MIAANLHGRTFNDVETLIHERAARVLPDRVVHLADLRMTNAGAIDVPGVGEMVPNDWAKKQLASLLGVRWDRWFAQASGDERAEETNRRLSRTPGEKKVRTYRGDAGKPGTLRALLSPSFTPIDDVRIIDRLGATMRTGLEEFVFSRVEVGDETTMLTAVHTKARDVRGDVHHPGFVLRNSEVGAASLSLDDYWFRLACQNGLLLQVGGKRALYRTHRAIEDDALQAALVVAMHTHDHCAHIAVRAPIYARFVADACRPGALRIEASRRLPAKSIAVSAGGGLLHPFDATSTMSDGEARLIASVASAARTAQLLVRDERVDDIDLFAPDRAAEHDEVALQLSPEEDPVKAVERVCRRFPAVVRELQRRHDHRAPLTVEDEYDVQDLLRALLRIQFDDVRKEEHTPSTAGSSARMDLLLKRERLVVEIKVTMGKSQKQIAQELAVDFEWYQKHPDCSTLICFVYDPDHRIENPTGFEKDLSGGRGALTAITVVAPQ